MTKQLKMAMLVGAFVAWVLPCQGVAASSSKAKSSVSKKVAADKPKQVSSRGKSRLVVRNGYIRAVSAKAPNRLEASPPFENGLALRSNAALVIDQTTGEALVQKNAEAVLPIASISKLMTALVVMEHQQDLQGIITITEDDIDTLRNTRSRITVGSTMTRETALLLALMSSENRAANALGRHFPGGMPAFVAAMNRKAASLGMTRTHFVEPTGLSNQNVSTARDLVKLVAASSHYPKIREATTTAEATVELGHRISEFHNTNALVKSPDWQISVSKTGYLHEAGRCLVMQAKVASRPVVIVLLDSVGKLTRVGDAQRIKRWMESASVGRSTRPV